MTGVTAGVTLPFAGGHVFALQCRDKLKIIARSRACQLQAASAAADIGFIPGQGPLQAGPLQRRINQRVGGTDLRQLRQQHKLHWRIGKFQTQLFQGDCVTRLCAAQLARGGESGR